MSKTERRRTGLAVMQWEHPLLPELQRLWIQVLGCRRRVAGELCEHDTTSDVIGSTLTKSASCPSAWAVWTVHSWNVLEKIGLDYLTAGPRY